MGISPREVIDEAQIFSRALSDAEILAIYQAGADGQCKPDIFVASIDPSYTVSGRGFRISTSVVIQDVNGVGINGATVQLGVILPNGSALTFPRQPTRPDRPTYHSRLLTPAFINSRCEMSIIPSANTTLHSTSRPVTPC